MDEEKLYIGCKIIKAVPMDRDSYFKLKGAPSPADENCHGYKVIYPDGYVSWSPRNTFENAYREITDGEITLLKS